MSALRNNYRELKGSKGIFFAPSEIKIVSRMRGGVTVISTVCPDYSNNGERYTFGGRMGRGVSLTTKKHLETVPNFLAQLRAKGLEVSWIILVADLPEVAESEREFFERVAGSRENYLSLCEESRIATQRLVGDMAQVETFSTFYSDLDYLKIQEGVAREILKRAEQEDNSIARKLSSFMYQRRKLAQQFRCRDLDDEELKVTAAHAMSLYIAHGTLMRVRYHKKNLIVINHETLNLKNFSLASLVDGYEFISRFPMFPLGIVENNLY